MGDAGRGPAATPRLDLLHGAKVLELSTRAAGTYAGRILALLGADVIRADLPAMLDCRPSEYGPLMAVLNEHKSLVGVNEVALDAARQDIDVLLIDSLEEHPDCEVREFLREFVASTPSGTPVVRLPVHVDGRVGSSITACATAGMSWGIGEPGLAPLGLPFDLAEFMQGAEGAGAVALCLLASGEGREQRLSVPLVGVLQNYVGHIASNFVPYERPWRRDGARATLSGGSYPAAMFECSDGWISIMCRTQPEWHALSVAVGHPEWNEDVRYCDSRVVARQHASELDPVLAGWCKCRTREQIFATARKHGFPAAPVLAMSEVLQLEQLAVREFFTEMEVTRSSGARTLVPGSPYRVEMSSGEVRSSAPRRLGGSRPLNGLRVVDLSKVWSGPMVASSLADLGADVIRVESRTRPDPTRLRGRGLRDGSPIQGPVLEVTPFHNQVNHMKRSIEIDITNPRGAKLVRDLVKASDIVIENSRPGVLARYGLDFASLSAEHPALVMVSLSMLGQAGPLAGIRGYAAVMTGLAGVDSLVGYSKDHLVGTFNPAIGDPNGAVHALAAALAALRNARATGRGVWIDVSQVEALISAMPLPILRAQGPTEFVPPGNAHSDWWPHGCYRCKGPDAWIAVVARSAKERDALLALATATGLDRTQAEQRLVDFFDARTREEASCELERHGIPHARVLSYDEAVVDWGTPSDLVNHPWLGTQRIFGLSWRNRGGRSHVYRPAPLLGADAEEILREVLHRPEIEIAQLVNDGIVGLPRSEEDVDA